MKKKITESSILITGANGGIGIETVKQLVKLKAKRIVLACRTQAKADEAIKRVNESVESYTILKAIGGFDMTNPDSIEKGVKSLSGSEPIDILFLQSGGLVISDSFQFITVNGISIEETIFQNVVGSFLTLKFLEEKNLLTANAKVVFAGGEGARGIPGMMEKPEFRSVEEFTSYVTSGKKQYNPMLGIGYSKFASALLVEKLATLNDDKEYIWFSPGLTGGTNGLDLMPNPKRFIMKSLIFPLMMKLGKAQGPKQAAVKFVDCLTGKYGKNGDILGAPEGKALGKIVDQKPMNASLTNHQLRDAFWDIISKITEDVIILNN